MEKIFDTTNVASFIEKLKSQIKAPFIKAYYSTLGGDERVSVIMNISADEQSTWSNGIYENSYYGRFYLSNDGTIEKISGSLPKFRKFRAKSQEQVIEKFNKYLADATGEKMSEGGHVGDKFILTTKTTPAYGATKKEMINHIKGVSDILTVYNDNDKELKNLEMQNNAIRTVILPKDVMGDGGSIEKMEDRLRRLEEKETIAVTHGEDKEAEKLSRQIKTLREKINAWYRERYSSKMSDGGTAGQLQWEKEAEEGLITNIDWDKYLHLLKRTNISKMLGDEHIWYCWNEDDDGNETYLGEEVVKPYKSISVTSKKHSEIMGKFHANHCASLYKEVKLGEALERYFKFHELSDVYEKIKFDLESINQKLLSVPAPLEIGKEYKLWNDVNKDRKTGLPTEPIQYYRLPLKLTEATQWGGYKKGIQLKFSSDEMSLSTVVPKYEIRKWADNGWILNADGSPIKISEEQKFCEGGRTQEGGGIGDILDMSREDRIKFIEEAIKKDPFYSEKKGSYRLIATKANEIIEKFFHINRKNPIYINGDKIYFEPDSRMIDRDGYLIAQAKYGAHFATQKSGNERFYASHKTEAVKHIEKTLKNPSQRLLQDDKGKKSIVYISEIETDNFCCMILSIKVEENGILSVVTVYPDKDLDYIQKKKASNYWLDASFSNFTEPPPADKVVSDINGGLNDTRTQDKDSNNSESEMPENMGNGGEIADLIQLIESQGKIRWEYVVDESAYKGGTGEAVLYDYDGKAYEIITWNEDAENHKAGEKTIAIGTKINSKDTMVKPLSHDKGYFLDELQRMGIHLEYVDDCTINAGGQIMCKINFLDSRYYLK